MSFEVGLEISGNVELASPYISSISSIYCTGVEISGSVEFSSATYVSFGSAIFSSGFETVISGGVSGVLLGIPSFSFPTPIFNIGKEIYITALSGNIGDTGQELINGYFADFYANYTTRMKTRPITFYEDVIGPIIVSGIWDFGDGTTATTSSGSIVHTYTDPGVYTVTMTVISLDDVPSTVIKRDYITITDAPSYPDFTDRRYRVILTNKRAYPYTKNDNSAIASKIDIIDHNKHFSYMKDIPVELWLNWTGLWEKTQEGITSRYGSITLTTPTVSGVTGLKNCLGVAVARINGETYVSSPARYNFCAREPISYYDFAPHTMTTNTLPSPYVASASSEYSANYKAYRAFDGSLVGGDGVGGNYHAWISSPGATGYLAIDMGDQYVLSSYQITMVTPAYDIGRAPKKWQIKGSNDNFLNSTVLDTRSDQTTWTQGVANTYSVSLSGVSFRYFKIDITGNNGGVDFLGQRVLEIGEMYLIGYSV